MIITIIIIGRRRIIIIVVIPITTSIRCCGVGGGGGGQYGPHTPPAPAAVGAARAHFLEIVRHIQMMKQKESTSEFFKDVDVSAIET
mmetsp:Transcript_17644/g.19991  ORF Transcript_17644/g.19991 Transcript_17644/m.19991 type:complete len:87 (+) Transcript_17644:285-545(+)